MSLLDIFAPTDRIYYEGDSKGLGAPHSPLLGAYFYSINPLSINWHEYNKMRIDSGRKAASTPRFSLNVAKFRNFVFESDVGTLEAQLAEWQKVAALLPVKQLTFSGGKSYHAVISCIDFLPFKPHTENGIVAYKHAWKALRAFIETNSSLKLDESTKDPARLTRLPNAVRENGVKQTEIKLTESAYISCEQILELMANFKVQPEAAPTSLSAANSERDFLNRLNAERALKLKLTHAHKWGAASNMYPALFRYTLWAIDAINPSYETLVNYMQVETFPDILAKGYDRDLTVPVRAAFAFKGLL